MPNWKKVIVSGSAAEITTLKATSLSDQSSEQTSLMINSSGVVGTRELGSNAFNSNTYNNYSLPLGSSSTRGGFKIGYSENGKNYPVEISSEKMYVNVPWVDTNTNTTYSAGSGISLNGTVFSNSGVLSLIAGDNVSLSAVTGTITISSTDTNTNTTYTAGGGLGLSGTTFSHSNTSSQSSVNGSGRTYIQDVTLDTYGHVTGLATATETVVNTDTNTQRSNAEIRDVTANQLTAGDNVTLTVEGENIVVSSTDTNTNTTYTAGGGLTLSGTTFSHTDTSARSSVNNGGRTYIQDITLDTYGHVTGLASATETVVNTDTNTQLSTSEVREAFSAGDNVTIEEGVISSTDTNTQLSTAQVRGKFSGNGINTSTGVITDTNTQLSDAQVRSKFTAGTNVSITAGGVISSTNTNTQRAAGSGLTLSGNTLSHTDTSSQGSVNNSGRTYIQDITLDTYGHVTGLSSATETVVNTNTDTQRSDAEIRDVTAGQLTAGDNVTLTVEGENIVVSSTDTNTNTQLSDAQVRSKISGGTNISYNSTTGVITNGITNNSQLTNGAGYRTSAQVNDAIAAVVDSAPAALNTLNELAAALGDDADFAGSVTTALSGKLGSNEKAADSNLLDGLDLHTGRNNVANRVVRTNGSGYLDTGWINTTSGTASGTLTRIYCSQDDYLRYLTPANFRNSIISAGTNVQISSTGVISATDTNTDTNTQRSDAEIRNVTAEQLTAGDNVTLQTEGNSIIISSTDTNTNTQLSTAQVRAKFSGNGINTSTGVITDTNTQLSDAQVRSKFSAGTNVSISAAGVISSTDTNTDTNTQRSDEEIRDVASAQWINGTNTTVVKSDSGNTIKINSVDTNTWRGIHDSPVNGATTTSISSNWAFDNVKTAVPAGALFTDTNTNTQRSDAEIRNVTAEQLVAGDNVTLQTEGNSIIISSTDTNTDTNTQRAAGSGLTLSGNTLSHTDTSSQGSVNNSGRTYIQDITLDTYGHVTGLSSATETVVNTDTNTQLSDAQVRSKFSAGTNVSISAAGVISSTDTNTNTQLSTAQVRAKFSGNGINTSTGVITDTNTQRSDEEIRQVTSEQLVAGENVTLQLEGNSIVISSTDTNTDTNTQRAAGGGLTLSGNTLSHTDTSSQGSVNNSGRTYIQDVTLDTYGHVTGLSSATETVVNTDTNTTYSADGNYGMTLSGTTFRLEDDRRRNNTAVDIYSGNTHDYTFYDASVGIRWYTAGSEEMRLLDNGTLHVDGDVVAYSTTVSDKRLKDNVTTIENPLDKIKALRGVEYDWNTGNRKGKHDLGLIAQEVEAVIPEIVHEHTLPLMDDTDTLYKTVDYEKMVAVLIEGMKEQQTQIESLKSEIETIKGKL